MPESAFTTPLRLIWSMARQRLPVAHPAPIMLRLTTGLTKGSRRLARLTWVGASVLASAGFFWFSTAICCLGCAFWWAATGLALGVADFAEILAGLLACLFCGAACSVAFVLLMIVGFCPRAVPAAIARKTIPVVSFIWSPA